MTEPSFLNLIVNAVANVKWISIKHSIWTLMTILLNFSFPVSQNVNATFV